MIAISISNVSLILGAQPIFRDLSWEIHHDQRVGFVGPNGAGKSSLLKLIIGEHPPEPGGHVVRAKGITVGYLAQEPELDPSATALEAALEGNPRVHELEAELTRLEARLGEPAVYGDGRALSRALGQQQTLVEEYLAPLCRPGALASVRSLMSSRNEAAAERIRQAIEEVRTPTLIVWGRDDAWTPVAQSERFARAIPGSQRVILDDCGHMPQEERPDIVLTLIRGFLEQVEKGGYTRRPPNEAPPGGRPTH